MLVNRSHNELWVELVNHDIGDAADITLFLFVFVLLFHVTAITTDGSVNCPCNVASE